MKVTEIFGTTPVVFVDMDGVLVDLYNYAAEIHDVDHYNNMTQQEWESFFKNSDAYHLFRDAPAFDNVNAILQLVEKYAGDYTLLTSPLGFDREGSIKGKKAWIQKHVSGNPKVIFEHDKFKYAKQADGTPNVLIDDYKGNTIPWADAGGVSIKFQNDEDPISKIEQILVSVFGEK
jgi:hypothetical protein